MRGLHPNDLIFPKSPPPNSLAVGFRISLYEFGGGGTNLLTIADVKWTDPYYKNNIIES